MDDAKDASDAKGATGAGGLERKYEELLGVGARRLKGHQFYQPDHSRGMMRGDSDVH